MSLRRTRGVGISQVNLHFSMTKRIDNGLSGEEESGFIN